MNDTVAIERASKQLLRLTVNGRRHELLVEPRRTLLQLLREDLQLTGAKEVCLLGACGACTVLVDDEPALSCLTLALACREKKVTTIEGLAAQDGSLHPLQQAFVDKGAVQCGYCTPGMILTGKALLDETPQPTPEQARQAIAGNLCRCPGSVQIVEAIVPAGRPQGSCCGGGEPAPKGAGEYLMPETGE